MCSLSALIVLLAQLGVREKATDWLLTRLAAKTAAVLSYRGYSSPPSQGER